MQPLRSAKAIRMVGTLALICKLFGIAVTGVLGIIGSLSDLRFPNSKKLTAAGRATVIWIAIGIVVGLLGEALSAISSEDSSRRLAEANGVILRNVENILTPIAGMTVGQLVDVPATIKPTKIYLERLAKLTMGVTPDGSLPTGVTRVDFGNGRKGFFINEQSDWSPKEDAEAGLGILATLDLLLVFNKNALSIESLRNGGPMPADYRVRMSAFGFSRSMDVRLMYEPARAALQVPQVL